MRYKWANKLLVLDNQYEKLLSIVKRAANNSCCICCDDCLACDAKELLREFDEKPDAL